RLRNLCFHFRSAQLDEQLIFFNDATSVHENAFHIPTDSRTKSNVQKWLNLAGKRDCPRHGVGRDGQEVRTLGKCRIRQAYTYQYGCYGFANSHRNTYFWNPMDSMKASGRKPCLERSHKSRVVRSASRMSKE